MAPCAGIWWRNWKRGTSRPWGGLASGWMPARACSGRKEEVMDKGITFAKDMIINRDEENFSFKGCKFGRDILVEAGVHFNVIGGEIGDRTIIRSGARVEGNSVVLGRESYLDQDRKSVV